MIFSLSPKESYVKYKERKVVGIKIILKILFSNWQLFIISILCCLSFAVLYGYFNSIRITDPENLENSYIEFQKATIYVLALTIGVFLPAVFLLIKELLDIHLINTKADIANITSVPVLGVVSHNNEKVNLVVNTALRSAMSKEFDAICTNLRLNLNPNKCNVVLFTSSIGGEGKSFLSLNLGSTLASKGKKVIYLEFDLHKPKLSASIGIDNSYGFTNYIASDTVTIESIIKPLWFHENCFIISSGVIPANSEEIFKSVKVETLISALKKQFDYIIIDCAPVGLISDVLLLEKLVDLTLYVVRQKYTYKSQLDILKDLKQNGKFNKLYLILNDNKSEKVKANYLWK